MRHHSKSSTQRSILPSVLLLAFAATVQAGPRTSTSYTVPADTTDAGGKRTTSAAYTNDGSIGGIVGISTVAAPAETAKAGYVGQLYEVTALQLAAASPTVAENATVQFSALAVLDDGTFLNVDGNSVAWSVVLGPLVGIDGAGLATAGAVPADTVATAQGVFLSAIGTVDLTVLDTDPDNFGAYAGDGLGDDWQHNFFGPPPNADAAPTANPDADPHDNRFEFLTGYDPTDSGDFFRFAVIEFTGTSTTLQLAKIIPGTRYHVERSNDFDGADPWSEFANFTTGSEVLDHQLTDPAATASRRFYRIGVEPE